jgi:hypothetical protein
MYISYLIVVYQTPDFAVSILAMSMHAADGDRMAI